MTKDNKGVMVESTIGEVPVDAGGSPIGVVRMDPQQAYVRVAELLQSFINEGNLEAWEQIRMAIDYVYENLDYSLGALQRESGFDQSVKAQVKEGKKLLFKPNIVSPAMIQPSHHGKGRGYIACTHWAFVAALMRWFHDKLDISYHEMALGEAGTGVTIVAEGYTRIFGKGETITPEGLIEGKSGEFYGGWGFYFARKYLAEAHQPGHVDDPLSGYAESVAGEYIPPGRAGNRLMVYDLNHVDDEEPRGRDVPVPNGSYYKEITLHKAVVGGDPNDAEDRRNYPGCVLVNVPKLKIHSSTLLTNAIKNLGIGLFPMGATIDRDPKSTKWKYALPIGPSPEFKTKIPHRRWHVQFDDQTGLPLKDENGNNVMVRTSGINGAMLDLLAAVRQQSVSTIHVVDAVETTNVSHDTMPFAKTTVEGYSFAALDPVALDLLCARYLFKTVPMAEARKLREEGTVPIDFVQRVPAPRVDGHNIVNGQGFDAPIARCNLLASAEKLGFGQRSYYVTGWDAVAGAPIASVQGHLGRVQGKKFEELITATHYYGLFKLLWDMQTTVFGYLRANDRLTGAHYLAELLAAFDENGDGVLDYEETGKNRPAPAVQSAAGNGSGQSSKNANPLRQGFFTAFEEIRASSLIRSTGGQDVAPLIPTGCQVAFGMSQAKVESKDGLFPTITWGQGKWPSLQYALLVATGRTAFGAEFPQRLSLQSLYGQAFQYADKVLNGGAYSGGTGPRSGVDSLDKYLAAVAEGAPALDFVLYVPKGLASVGGVRLPNVEETEDTAKVFTAAFDNGRDAW